jgi:hypothetical protein
MNYVAQAHSGGAHFYLAAVGSWPRRVQPAPSGGVATVRAWCSIITSLIDPGGLPPDGRRCARGGAGHMQRRGQTGAAGRAPRRIANPMQNGVRFHIACARSDHLRRFERSCTSDSTWVFRCFRCRRTRVGVPENVGSHPTPNTLDHATADALARSATVNTALDLVREDSSAGTNRVHGADSALAASISISAAQC